MKWDDAKPIMPKRDRLDWLCSYYVNRVHKVREKIGTARTRTVHKSYSLSTLDADFVDDYLQDTNATFRPMLMGAHSCHMLARDLRQLANDGILLCCIIGNPDRGQGWPKWCYTYKLNINRLKEARRRAEWFKAKREMA